jgi:tRNA(Ile)-lysidine synthase
MQARRESRPAEAGKAGPVSLREAAALFSDLANSPALVLAVSGGPDSTALLVLAARWRASLKTGPKLVAVTVDHGLRPESAAEAQAVARLARRLRVAHRILRWQGRKPKTGVQAAARAARYRLLAQAAREAGARHVLTAHTRDDQAETVLLRLARGSGLAGLAAMARVAPLPTADPFSSAGKDSAAAATPRGRAAERPPLRALHVANHVQSGRSNPPLRPLPGNADKDILLVRPLLDLPKARLVATLKAARLAYAEDPSNQNARFARARLRTLMPALAQEGLSAERLCLFARRMRRANTAIERAVDAAFTELQPVFAPGPLIFDAEAFASAPEEIALRVLGRAISLRGDEGPVELGKLETLYGDLAAQFGTNSPRLRRTLAGALIVLDGDRLMVDRAPPRQARRPALTKRKGGRRKVDGRH